MGVSAMIWPATDDEIRACSSDPRRVSKISGRYSLHSKDPSISHGHAYIHGARDLEPLLDGFAAADLGVHRVEDAPDPSYTMKAARVRALHAAQAGDPCYPLLTRFSTMAINHVEIADVVRMAANTGHGLAIRIFEDW